MDAEAWDERYAAQELVWGAEPNRLFAQTTAHLPPGRALDLACGEGRNAVWLATAGWRVTAVDFSAAALDKGRQLASANKVEVDWVLADLLAYHPAASAFDLVAVLYLHLPPDQRRIILERAAGALAQGGTLVVIGHDRDNIAHGYGGPSDPAILLAPAAVAKELPGLTIQTAETVIRTVETEDGPRHALDTFVLAVRPV